MEPQCIVLLPGTATPFGVAFPWEAPLRAGKTRPNLQCEGASLSGRLLAVGLESEKLETELDE